MLSGKIFHELYLLNFRNHCTIESCHLLGQYEYNVSCFFLFEKDLKQLKDWILNTTSVVLSDVLIIVRDPFWGNSSSCWVCKSVRFFDDIPSVNDHNYLTHFSHLIIIRNRHRSNLFGMGWPEVRAHGNVRYWNFFHYIPSVKACLSFQLYKQIVKLSLRAARR